MRILLYTGLFIGLFTPILQCAEEEIRESIGQKDAFIQSRGRRGHHGRRGHRGHRGKRGPKGCVGDVGPIGIGGLTGSTGAPGPQGAIGPAGEDSTVSGVTGGTGPAGPIGSQGLIGNPGTLSMTNPSFVLLTEDFVSGTLTPPKIGALGWSPFGTQSLSFGSGPSDDHPGWIRSTIAPYAGAAGIQLSMESKGVTSANDYYDVTMILRVNETGVTTQTQYFFGLGDSASSNPQNYVGFWKQPGENYWICTYAINGEFGGGGSVLMETNTWMKFRFRRIPGGVEYYLNGNWINSIVGQPVGPMSLYIVQDGSLAPESNSLDIDYVSITLTPSR